MSSRYYDKDVLKNSLEPEQIFDLLQDWGGQPTWEDSRIVSDTICHNDPGEGSHKLYYYFGTRLFVCYTNCGTFDIFELCIKVAKTQKEEDWELYDAMDYIASYFGFEGISPIKESEKELDDWKVFKRHNYQILQSQSIPILKEYNPIILTRFCYPRIEKWEQEGISADISRANLIGYYPGRDQIVIPHFDINNRLIGIRGRYLADDLANKYGKYRPLKVNRQLYNHPLSMNLYNLNNSKDCIKKSKVAIIFEGEKSTLQFQSFYGRSNDISIACCGSNLSSHQVNLLKELGVRELILAFDRQFIEIDDDEFKRLTTKLLRIYNKYKTILKVTAIFDKNMITPYKASPTDCGREIFEKLLKERIILE